MTSTKRPIRVAGRDSLKELLADLGEETDAGIAAVLKKASPGRSDTKIQQAVEKLRGGRSVDSIETRKPVHPASLRSSVHHAIRSPQQVHGALAEWEGTKTLPRDVQSLEHEDDQGPAGAAATPDGVQSQLRRRHASPKTSLRPSCATARSGNRRRRSHTMSRNPLVRKRQV